MSNGVQITVLLQKRNIKKKTFTNHLNNSTTLITPAYQLHAQKAKGSDCLYEFVPPTIFENEKKNPGGFETPENC